MSASLVGSEMCIRDSCSAPTRLVFVLYAWRRPKGSARALARRQDVEGRACLLYTSDAADDM
eukprot:10798-Alexandrium_andersonii.AAC.1